MRGLWPSVLVLSLACGARSSLPQPDGEGGADEGGGGTGGEALGGGGGGEGGVGGVEELALGAGHSCLRTIEGDVYCWGRNSQGQLGIGEDVSESLTPRHVELPARAVMLGAGSFHTCAFLEDGTLACWGKNEHGQLGVEGGESSTTPVIADLEVGDNVPLGLALGEEHSCALTAEPGAPSGDLYCWGQGSSGQVGPQDPSSKPTAIYTGIVDIAAGAFHSCFVNDGGVGGCFGDNNQFQLGADVGGFSFDAIHPDFPPPPFITNVSAGRGQHTCAWGYEFVDGIRCWGDNDSGQLGVAPAERLAPSQTATIVLDGLVDIQAGFAHTCALASGQVYCWGENGSGQLGTPGPSHSDPAPVAGMTNMVAMATGTIHSCAVRSPTEVYCWGGNDFGQLGDGTMQSSDVPVAVRLP